MNRAQGGTFGEHIVRLFTARTSSCQRGQLSPYDGDPCDRWVRKRTLQPQRLATKLIIGAHAFSRQPANLYQKGDLKMNRTMACLITSAAVLLFAIAHPAQSQTVNTQVTLSCSDGHSVIFDVDQITLTSLLADVQAINASGTG